MAKKIKAPKENNSSFKKSFKRFKNTLTLLIFLAFAGFVFYTGWIQIRIPEGSFALIYTKTHGYDSALVAPGQFVWRWENLFPTNMTIHYIELNRQKENFSLNSYLPSGRLYGEYIKHPEAFAYNIEVEYRFLLKESAFGLLVESGHYKADSLNNLYDDFRTLANSQIESYFQDIEDPEFSSLETIEEELMYLISEADSSFRIADLKIRALSYPDIELYEKSRTLFLEELKAVKELEFDAQQQTLQIENSTDRKMDLLRQYGEVFSEYPVLLQYFDLDKEKLDPSLLRETGADSQGP